MNHALTLLWPQLMRNAEREALSRDAAEKFVEEAFTKLRDTGKEMPKELRSILLWHLTTCFPVENGGLQGIHGIFGTTTILVCPSGLSLTCALKGLDIPLSKEARSPTQLLEASLCAAAIHHMGEDAAAYATITKGRNLATDQVVDLALAKTKMKQTDSETKQLLQAGIRAQLQLQKGFQRLQWRRFVKYYKLASAFRLAQRLLLNPQREDSSSAGAEKQALDMQSKDVLNLATCVAKRECLGIGNKGYHKAVLECIEINPGIRETSVLHHFFQGTRLKLEDRLSAEVFATSLLVLESILQGAKLGTADAAQLLQLTHADTTAFSLFHQLIAKSFKLCSLPAAEIVNSHLEALRATEATATNPALLASIALENAPLLFSLNAVHPPAGFEDNYQSLKHTGTQLGLAVIRRAAKMINMSCGKDRNCNKRSNAYISCISESIESVAWTSHRDVLKQRLHVLAHFAENPDLLPEGPPFTVALTHFKSAAAQMADTIRKFALASHGALVASYGAQDSSSNSLAESLEQFVSALDDNILPTGFTFFDDGELSLYGPLVQEQIASRQKRNCSGPRASGRDDAMKTFLVMQILSPHLNAIIGNAALLEVYGITAGKTGLSVRAVESTFVRAQAHQIYIFTQSLLDNPEEDSSQSIKTSKELRAYVTSHLAAKLGQKRHEGTDTTQKSVSKDILVLAKAVYKEIQKIFAKRITMGQAFSGLQQATNTRVKTWLEKTYTDFRRELPPSYVVDAAYDCLQHCVKPLLADTRVQTQCTDSAKKNQPLNKCADPANEFQKQAWKGTWGIYLSDWLAQGNAPKGCSELLQLLGENDQAWKHQVYLMYSHLDYISCGKDMHGRDSYNRYSIKLDMLHYLYEMFVGTSKKPTLAAFLNWLVKLREPLHQNLQIPTAQVLAHAEGQQQNQVSISKAFNLAVARDPSYAQCKPEDTKIISELVPSLGDMFLTLAELDNFIEETSREPEILDRKVAVPPAETQSKPYTFPATAGESLAASVFGWQVPAFPPLRCQRPTRQVVPLPVITSPRKEPVVPTEDLIPPPLQKSDTTVLPEDEYSSSKAEEPEPGQGESASGKADKEKVVNTEGVGTIDPEEVTVPLPPVHEELPKVDAKDDDCLKLVQLYERYIEGSQIKDVEALHEQAVAIPLFKHTRSQLRIKDGDISLQTFRLALCITCAKHIPTMQLATGEARAQLSASIERSKEACDAIYKNTHWAKEVEGGVPLSFETPASPLTKSIQLNLPVPTISHRLLGAVHKLLESAGENKAKAVEACASAEVLGRSLQHAMAAVLKKNQETRSPLLLALGGLSKTASKDIPAQLASIFGSPARIGGRTLPPTSMAGGLMNWLPQDRGLAFWAASAHKKLKFDEAVAGLCAALRYAEFIQQVTRPGMMFDRILAQWNLSLPLNGLSLVNALRSHANTQQKLVQDLCVLMPPGDETQGMLRRFDPHQWAALSLETEHTTGETIEEGAYSVKQAPES
ncbi:uncharacterized protein LOC34621071 [Cyclospora cayetanensis]|uniref:Uncharacterized protein LOC34621071 n=1 Tax=Cyclospora cayetanensis TaxID=88456 RepID=A0A6P6RYX3_9EIME|nr:uncharacterized protein LOC34621071 [Cyclospora cayetanensis]